MSTIRLSLVAALLVGAVGCYQESAYAQGTIPQQPPQEMQGPPGGAMDPGYGYAAPQQAQPDDQDPNAQAYVDPNDPNAANAQQQDPYGGDSYGADYGTGDVSDGQIDATLDGYGSWETDEDYGRVWYPDTTVVGVNFTPYETCGSWVWSDNGWLYTCDYTWGWLPFHYGRWGWFDNRWGWVPGYQWGPAWVDWRYGGGYIGWRPLAPQWKDGREWHVRDHRHGVSMDSHWRFAGEHDFGQAHIRGHLFQNPSEGLRVTQPMRPPTPRDIAPVRAQAVMQAHMPPHGIRTQSHFGTRPTTPWQPGRDQPIRGPAPTWHAPQQAYQQPFHGPQQQQQPTWRGPQQTWRAPQQPTWRAPQDRGPQTWQRGPQQPTWRGPQQTYQPPTSHQPQQPAWHQPQQPTWHAPVQAYRPPTQSYSPPARTYSPPAHTYSPPSHSYSAPSHSYSAPSHSYSAPSHSSGGGSSHSSGGGGSSHSSGGGGGHHR